LIDLPRAPATIYPPVGESPLNLLLMRLIDEQYTRTPFYGRHKMAAHLRRQGYAVNHKRVGRLMHKMGLQAVYPRPRTSIPDQQHKKYPYLLRGLNVNQSRIRSGRRISPTCRCRWASCTSWSSWTGSAVLSSPGNCPTRSTAPSASPALRLALRLGQPEIFNTDQGVQFTARDFTVSTLEAAQVRVSMDGRGRVFDNIFVERLWRTVKYEDIYIKEYATVPALAAGLHDYFQLYNYERPHQSLGYRTPADVYFAVKEPLLLSA
jgi:putative transposase